VVYHGRDPRIGADLTKRQLVPAIPVFDTGRESSTRKQARVFFAMNNRLRPISGSKPLLLNSTDGQETLAGAAGLFRYIDSNFEHWNCNTVGPPTKETAVEVHEIVSDCTFQQMFGSFDVTVDCLTLTQAQIKQFAKRYPDWLKKGGSGTFFLFKTGNEFFVAAVYFFVNGRLGVRVRRLTLERVFRAQKRHRVVVKSYRA
jgi:hypothetical protein